MTRRLWIALGVAAAFFILFLRGLDDVGVLSVDEPRYAAIGRDMARGGDWITPRLWGEPWLEKPALLYWLIALGTRAGLPGEWAPRFPVAAVSILFLVFYWRTLRTWFGARAAWYATAMLASSAGWIAFSRVAVPDLLLAAACGAALLAAGPWAVAGAGHQTRTGLLAAGVFFGLALLAKGLVACVLALPILWWGRGRLVELVPPLALGAAVAVPWYWACYAANGWDFVRVFFLEHHFARFAGSEQLHYRPVWFYAPVLLAGLLPWTPMLATLASRQHWEHRMVRYLAGWALFGFVFFSASAGKLPGYLLPLFPALCAVLGFRMAEGGIPRWTLAAAAPLSLWMAAAVLEIAPRSLLSGVGRAGLGWGVAPAALLLVGLLLGIAVIVWRRVAFEWLVALHLGIAAIFLPWIAEAVERNASARAVWNSIPPPRGGICTEDLHRLWRFGLNYYAGAPLAECPDSPASRRLRTGPDGRPVLTGP